MMRVNASKKSPSVFKAEPAKLTLAGALEIKQSGRSAEILANGNSENLMAELQTQHPEELRCESLSLEEIFVASKTLTQSGK